MTTVARKEVRCALCGKRSHCDVIGSWNDFGEQDTELRQYAVGMDPLDLFVVNCPHCGYVAYDLETELQSDRLEEIRQLVAAFHADKIRKNGDLPIHERYGLLAQIQQTLPESDEVIAETFLRAAWKADDLSQDGPATHYRQQAAIYLKGMLVSCPDESEKMAMQLKLSEVYRRSGEFEPALQLLKSIEADNAVPMLGMLVSALKRLSESKDRRQHFFKELFSNG